jgi:hypothetical protein
MDSAAMHVDRGTRLVEVEAFGKRETDPPF